MNRPKLRYQEFAVHFTRATTPDTEPADTEPVDETPDGEDKPANKPVLPEGDGTREIEGLAVPYGVETQIWDDFFEVINPGAVEEPEDAPVLLFWRHEEPIGVVMESSNDQDGYRIRARISQTPRGDEAYQLLQDGVLSRLSIGFEPLEWLDAQTERGTLRTQTRIVVREVSVVPFPAYNSAAIDAVRAAHPSNYQNRNETKDKEMTVSTVKASDLEDIRSQVNDLARDVAMSRAQGPVHVTQHDARSAGAFLKDLVSGDTATRDAYDALARRAWDGTKIADDALNNAPMWTKDLVAIYEAEDYIGRHFNQAALGGTGMTAEFLKLATNTLRVSEQAEEGADLVFGKMSTRVEVARVKTFGGYTSLSKQEIERGSASLLTKQLQALAMAAGYAAATQFEADFKAAVTANAAKKLSYSKALNTWTWTDIAGFIIKAVDTFRAAHLPLDGMIVDPVVFTLLAAMVDGNDNPRMTISGTQSAGTTVGSIDTSSLTGQLGALTIQPYWGMEAGALGTGVNAVLFSKQAITRYQTGLTQLQDSNIVNLTEQFSVYRYGMNAVEMPDGLIPLALGPASTVAAPAAAGTTPAAAGTTPAAA